MKKAISAVLMVVLLVFTSSSTVAADEKGMQEGILQGGISVIIENSFEEIDIYGKKYNLLNIDKALNAMDLDQITYLIDVIEQELTGRKARKEMLLASSREESHILGHNAFVFQGAKIDEDYKGNPCVIITIEWTHYLSDAESFSLATETKAYQDGIQLDVVFVRDSSVLGSYIKSVSPGEIQEVKLAFGLVNETSDVEFVLSEQFGNEKIRKSFAIYGD